MANLDSGSIVTLTKGSAQNVQPLTMRSCQRLGKDLNVLDSKYGPLVDCK